jgi:ribosomal protein L34E
VIFLAGRVIRARDVGSEVHPKNRKTVRRPWGGSNSCASVWSTTLAWSAAGLEQLFGGVGWSSMVEANG